MDDQTRLQSHGHRSDLFYDNRNRALGFDWNDGYTPQQRTEYDAASRVTQIWNWNSTINFTYFESGQPNYLSGNSMHNRFLFQGALFVPEAEIYDMRNRFYHPNLGRFMQSDPIGFDAGDTNLFRYCGNDPVNRSDPDGLHDINLLPQSDRGYAAANRAPLSPDRITVIGHGMPTYMLDSNGNRRALASTQLHHRMPAEKLAYLIMRHPKYTPKILVRLDVCSAGD